MSTLTIISLTFIICLSNHSKNVHMVQLADHCNTLSLKGKAIPLQAWTGPEGSRRLRPPDFKTISTWRR